MGENSLRERNKSKKNPKPQQMPARQHIFIAGSLISFLQGFMHALSFLFELNPACPGLIPTSSSLRAFCKYSAKSQTISTPQAPFCMVCAESQTLLCLPVGGRQQRGSVSSNDQINSSDQMPAYVRLKHNTGLVG